MQRGFAAGGKLGGLNQHGIFIETTVFDVLVNAGQALIDHPTGAQIHVADLGIAHLSGRQTNGLPGRIDQRRRSLLPQAVPGRSGRVGDGVAVGGFPMAPAIKNQKKGGGFLAHGDLGTSGAAGDGQQPLLM